MKMEPVPADINKSSGRDELARNAQLADLRGAQQGDDDHKR
jgi:hypothetical protein